MWMLSQKIRASFSKGGAGTQDDHMPLGGDGLENDNFAGFGGAFCRVSGLDAHA
jgi:hypothetical protein